MAEIEFSRPLSLEELRVGKVERTLEATGEECKKLAVRFHLLKIENLKATVTVFRDKSGVIHVQGKCEAKIEQECVRTLEPLSTSLKTPFSISYITESKAKHVETPSDLNDLEAPEILEEDVLDLGEIVAQTLSLEIDPYPTKGEKD